MTKSFLKKNWQILSFNFVLLLLFCVFYGKFGNIIVDTYREAYIPEQILTGKALYKDIFTIYSPFAYLFNALLFLIFGTNIKVLAFAGLIVTGVILNLIYKIANKFMPETYSFIILMFIISTGIISPNVFNFIMPYSFGLLYGLAFILGSLYSVLKRNYIAGYFLYGLAICSKYEFILFLPVLIWADWQKDKLKNFWLKCISFVIPILTVISILYMQKVVPADIIISVKFMLNMASAKTTHWFYTISGLIFKRELLPIYLLNIIKVLIPLAALNRVNKMYSVPLVIAYCWMFIDTKLLIYAFPLILVLFLFRYKKLNFYKRFFILSSLLISAKVFWALLLSSYGTFFTPFCLISIIILAPKSLKKDIITLILVFALVLGIKNSYAMMHKNVKISTEKGIVYSEDYYGEPIKELIQYLQTNTEKEDTVIVYPECLAVNFLADRKSDNKFYSLIPLYAEVFGEDLIIHRLILKKPKYVVISNFDTSDYYFKQFGKDYGKNTAGFIKSNYTLIKEIGTDFRFKIYRLK